MVTKEKEEKKPKSINVNCSFCGKGIECPENMKNVEKHACFECFQKLGEKIPAEEVARGRIHVDMPMGKAEEMLPGIMASLAAEEFFPMAWKEKKSELKEMSKKEIAKYMFAAGAGVISEHILHLLKEAERQDKETEK